MENAVRLKMYNIILDDISIKDNIVYYTFSTSKELNKYFKANTLFVEFPVVINNIPKSILTIPFIATFIGIAWMENANLYVNELDETYYYSMREVRNAFQDMYFNAKLKGRIVPCKIINNQLKKSKESLLLFGGGVDAHCSYIRNKENINGIINIQGWFNNISDSDSAADDDKKHCADFAKSMNIDFNYIRSNFASIINSKNFNNRFEKILGDQWWHGIQHSMAFIGIAIPLALYYNISNIIIASSCTVGRQLPCGSFITTDSAFQFAINGRVLHDAFELNRQNKVKIIVDYQRSSNLPYPLKVCSFNDKNCCECEKCFRTIIEIIAENGDIRNFGFKINSSYITYFEKVLERKLGLWGMNFEREIYWKDTSKRMKENYHLMTVENQEFCEWFNSFDFDKEQKASRWRYYKNNFFSIIKRKLYNLINNK